MQRRHVIVVGGGVVGCATAYRLARAGFAVSLVERDAIAAHASAWNAGNLNPLHETPEALLPIALEAFRRHGELREELDPRGDAALRAVPVGRIFLGTCAQDRARLEATAALYERTRGFAARWLDRQALGLLEPGLAGDIEFGLLTHGSLAVDGEAFTRGLARAAGAFGAKLIHATVSGVATSAERVTAVRTSTDTIPCDAVVFATGPWVSDLQAWLGLDVPVEPVKGELLLVRYRREPIAHDLTLGRACLYRRRDQEIWVGGTWEHAGFDARPTAAGERILFNAASKILPDIGAAQVVRHVAGLRPVPRSGLPLAAAAVGWHNVYLANGGGAKGLLLSLSIAVSIRDMLLRGTAADPGTHRAEL